MTMLFEKRVWRLRDLGNRYCFYDLDGKLGFVPGNAGKGEREACFTAVDRATARFYSLVEGWTILLFRWNIFVTHFDLMPERYLCEHRWVLMRRNVFSGPLRYDNWHCLRCGKVLMAAPGLEDPGGWCVGDFKWDLLKEDGYA